MEIHYANKYSASDISELVPGTHKSIILYALLQNNMAKQITAWSKGELMKVTRNRELCKQHQQVHIYGGKAETRQKPWDIILDEL